MNKIRCIATAGPLSVITYGQHGPTMVLKRCAKTTMLGYWCGTHQQEFPTLEALVIHLNEGPQAGEDHRDIAVYCSEHRTLESANYQQIRALTRDVTFALAGVVEVHS